MNVTNPVPLGTNRNRDDTQQQMAQFMKSYVIKHNIEPKKQWVKELIQLEGTELETHFAKNLINTDSNVFKVSMLQSPEFQQWIGEIEKGGYCYKYRWADTSIMKMFYDIYHPEEVYDYGFVKNGQHDPGALRYIEGKVKTKT